MREVLFCLLLLSAKVCFTQTGMWTWMGGDSTPWKANEYGAKKVTSPQNKPGGKCGGISWVDSYGKVWIFGGWGLPDTSTYPIHGDRKNDLWNYDPATDEWTWITGSKMTLAGGTFGSIGVPSVLNTPGARITSATWTDAENNLWLFGGDALDATGKYGLTSDMWKFNTGTSEWTWVNGQKTTEQPPYFGVKGVSDPANHPGGRWACGRWKDKQGNFWIFGGFAKIRGTPTYINDLWRYTPLTNQWTWMKGDSSMNALGVYGTKGVPSVANKPGARIEALSWTDKSGNFWLYGGQNNSTTNVYFNDLWKYEPTTGMWTWVHGSKTTNTTSFGTQGVASPTNNPGARSGSITWTDIQGNLWLFGGGVGDVTNNLWHFDISTNMWTWVKGSIRASDTAVYGSMGIASPVNTPRGLGGAFAWSDSTGALWLFGGLGKGDPYYGRPQLWNDMWKFSPDKVYPLHLLTFTGKLNDDAVNLQWTSENEQGFSHYEVERSADGRKWSKIGSVKSKGENRRSEYQYSDLVISYLSSVNSFYYRLRMVDNDGSFTYSNIVNIRLGEQSSFNIYPNPATTSVQLQFAKTVHGRVDVSIADVTGKVVMRKVYNVERNASTLSTAKLAAGTYLVRVRMGDEVWSERLVIRK